MIAALALTLFVPGIFYCSSIFIAYLASDLLLSLYYNSKWAGYSSASVHLSQLEPSLNKC
jgi:hypothetical protein